MSEVQLQTSELPPDFAHEGEHPQVRLPFTLILEQRHLRGESLSLTRAVATGLINPNWDGRRIAAIIRFDLEGFILSLPVEAVVAVAGPSEDAEVVITYTNPTGSHLPVMRYLINSFIAGDVVSISGMLSYTGPVKVKPAAKTSKPSAVARIGQIGRKLGVAALTVGLVFLATNIVTERVLFSYEPRPVQITESGQVLRATAAGQISYVDPQASEGDVIYSILANSGDLLSVRMPCDCAIDPNEEFFEGSTVLPGTPLVRLSASDSSVMAETELTYEGTARFLKGDQPELVFPDSQVVPVTLTLLPIEGDSGALQPVSINLPEASDVAAGTPARLRFRRQIFPNLDLSWMASAKSTVVASLPATFISD